MPFNPLLISPAIDSTPSGIELTPELAKAPAPIPAIPYLTTFEKSSDTNPTVTPAIAPAPINVPFTAVLVKNLAAFGAIYAVPFKPLTAPLPNDFSNLFPLPSDYVVWFAAPIALLPPLLSSEPVLSP